MIKHYTLENKPTFKDGELVKIDMSCFGYPTGYPTGDIRIGKVVGKGMTHIIDYWLIEFENDFVPTYPYKVVQIQHTFIVDEK